MILLYGPIGNVYYFRLVIDKLLVTLIMHYFALIFVFYLNFLDPLFYAVLLS